jgi:hypothetical protein
MDEPMDDVYDGGPDFWLSEIEPIVNSWYDVDNDKWWWSYVVLPQPRVRFATNNPADNNDNLLPAWLLTRPWR